MGNGRLASSLGLLIGMAIVVAACSSDGGDGTAGVVDSQMEPAIERASGAPDPADDGEAEAEAEPETVDEEPGPTPGVLVWVHDQEPPDLHLDDPTNGLPVTSWIREALLDSLFGVDSTISYYPELLAAEPDVSAEEGGGGPVIIEYELRSGLTWSDGTPLTAADVEYTHSIITEGCATEPDGSILDGSIDGCIYLRNDRSGYDLITGFEVLSDTEFRVTMAGFFPAWRDLYAQIFAAHAFGEDAAAVNENLRDWSNGATTLPSSGPMVFQEWDRGVSLELVRNDLYHGSVSPDAQNDGPAEVDGVRVDFVTVPEEQIRAVQAGTAQVIMTDPQPEFEALVGGDDFTVAAVAGPTFEHWGLNLLNSHLAKPDVREAIAYALDKGQVVTELYEPLFGETLPTQGLGNTYWMANQPPYQDHQAAYEGSRITEAKASLESAGYRVGPDGVYRHPTDGRLSLRVGTIGGDTLREAQELLIQEQLAGAGIEIIIDNVAGGAYFRERPFADDAIAASISAGADGDSTIWDITQFAWVGGPWPGGRSGSYRSASRNNPYGFADPEFDVRASECDATPDDDDRADCYNELDTYVTTSSKGTQGLFMIPLTQKPSFFGYNSGQMDSVGIAPDNDFGGPLANIVDYRFKEAYQ